MNKRAVNSALFAAMRLFTQPSKLVVFISNILRYYIYIVKIYSLAERHRGLGLFITFRNSPLRQVQGILAGDE